MSDTNKIEIIRTEEVTVTPVVKIPDLILNEQQFNALIQRFIDEGWESGERITLDKFIQLVAKKEMQQSADADGSHTTFVPIVRVSMDIK